MNRILILGHKGLLGSCLYKYFSSLPDYSVSITDYRWPEENFRQSVEQGKYDWIINCIITLPQSGKLPSDMMSTNVGLPVFLSSLPSSIIHPSSNDISENSNYSISKAAAECVLSTFRNTFIIRCSIIGIENGNSKSLLNWFLNSEEIQLNGYTNHLWNGITSLDWAKIAELIVSGNDLGRLIIPYSDTVSKFELLTIFRRVFQKKIDVVPVQAKFDFQANSPVNLYRGNVEEQLLELKSFYFP